MKQLLFFCCTLALAEDAAAPQITIEQKLDYRRAQVNLLTAQTAFNAVVQTLQKMCGAGALVLDEKGDPACKSDPPAAH